MSFPVVKALLSNGLQRADKTMASPRIAGKSIEAMFGSMGRRSIIGDFAQTHWPAIPR